MQLQRVRKTWEIGHEEIVIGEQIGRGAFGAVFRGVWRRMDVAIKTMTGAYMNEEDLQRELDNEASALQTVRHAHIVQFFGAGTLQEGTPFIVTELMELGSLTGVLRRDTTLDWVTKRRFAYEIATAMELVHSLGRMHRDMKSGNVLVWAVEQRGSLVMHVKVADFGTATLIDKAFGSVWTDASQPTSINMITTLRTATVTARTKGIGTPLWMAPEVISGQRYNQKADVYSYGIVMWEIASQSEPWADVEADFLLNKLLELIREGVRPTVASDWPQEYVSVMQQCWSTESAQRPTFVEVARVLNV